MWDGDGREGWDEVRERCQLFIIVLMEDNREVKEGMRWEIIE